MSKHIADVTLVLNSEKKHSVRYDVASNQQAPAAIRNAYISKEVLGSPPPAVLHISITQG